MKKGFFVLLLCSLFAAVAQGADWNGAGSGNIWNENANWGGAAYPTDANGDTAYFDGVTATFDGSGADAGGIGARQIRPRFGADIIFTGNVQLTAGGAWPGIYADTSNITQREASYVELETISIADDFGTTARYTIEGGTLIVSGRVIASMRGNAEFFVQELDPAYPTIVTIDTLRFGNVAAATGKAEISGGDVTVKTIDNNQTGAYTLSLIGGLLKVGDGGISDPKTINLSGGTLQSYEQASAWDNLTTLDANLTGDGAGNDVTFAFGNTAATQFTWAGDLTGTGGLIVENNSGTPWDVPRAYSYTGDTKILAGEIDLTNTAANSGVLSSGRIVTATGTTIRLQANDTTQFPAATIVFQGGTVAMDAPTAAAFTTNMIVEADGGTLESTTAGQSWAVNPGATTIDPAANLTLAGVGDGDLQASLASGSVTKAGTGTWTLSAANTYSGTTTVTAGTLLLGADNALPAAGDLAVAAGGTLDTNGSDASVGALSGDGNIENNHATEPTNLAIQSGTFVGSIQDDIAVTKTSAGTLTLSGTNSYSGTTTVSEGTFVATGTLYDGVPTEAAFNLALGVTCDLAAATIGATDVRLYGGYTYDAAFLNQSLFYAKNMTLGNNAMGSNVAFTIAAGDKIGNGGGKLNSLTIDTGSTLLIEMDATDIGIAKIAVANGITIAPAEMTVRLSGVFNDGSNLILLDAGAGNLKKDAIDDWVEADWKAFETTTFNPNGYTLTYDYAGGLLTCSISEKPTPADDGSGTNIGATDTILAAQNPTGDTKIAQDLLRVAATLEERDQITQQFTPSMALAQAAQSVQTSSQLLQTVGQQLTVPWDSGYASGVNILRANNGRHSCGRDINSWFQGFGYAGEQAVKDDFAGYNNSGWGVAVGLDKAFTSRSTLGLAYGYSQTALNSTPFISGSETPSSVNTNGHSLVGYALVRSSCETFFAFKAGSTWYAVDGVRRPFASDPNRIYTYETDANTWYLQATLGWQWLRRPSFSLTPKGKLAYFNYSQSAYLENRPGLAPSSVDAYSNGYTQADLLLDFQLFFSNQLTLNTSVGYRGLVGADGAVMTSSADGVSYNVNGVSAAEHQFVLDIGSVFEINRNALLTTEYNFRTGQGSHLHGGTGSLVLTF